MLICLYQTFPQLQKEQQQSTARDEEDVKTIHDLEETVSRLQEEIRVLNLKVSGILYCKWITVGCDIFHKEKVLLNQAHCLISSTCNFDRYYQEHAKTNPCRLLREKKKSYPLSIAYYKHIIFNAYDIWQRNWFVNRLVWIGFSAFLNILINIYKF